MDVSRRAGIRSRPMTDGVPAIRHPAHEGMRSVLIGVVANALLAIAKGLAGFFGNSYALIADAIESAFDIFTSILVWFGLRYASRPPDENHPYGHGKAEPLVACVVSMTLMAAAFLIGVESVREIQRPHHAPAPFTLVVLVVVVVAKELLFRSVARTGEEMGSTAVKTDAWHHRSDAITSGAAFIGISIALVGGPGYESADDFAALLAAGVIAFNAVHLLRPALAELLDAAPPKELADDVRRAAAGVGGVLGLDKCVVRKVGLDLYVDLHVRVHGQLTVHDGHRIAHDVKDAIQADNARVRDVIIHVEPATAAEEAGGGDPFIME
ncbi:MAG: Cobalt-zinc-cadmium resistance protein [uncultured Phycisphaerae bacterium]|uniref:Cobalt-zinc-cadmium resistance protein n=1 Tax=uncultured Phycisphaerae bacterium TaxID=904963 RepID=A0A6J4QEL5_9BACT|nr:MAG: Cobalt-zinc-cadmium resistance protein [uncultured Phycisphaerae bacterium]